MPSCPECESRRNHPSRAGDVLEKLFYLITFRRLYRCEDCAAIFLDFIFTRDRRPQKSENRPV
jgi:hypothetical protein